MTRNEFNEIIHSCYKKLYRIAFRIVRNRPEAEDAVQDVFLKMWKMGNDLDKYSDAEALAVTIIRNRCIDLIRKRNFSGEFDQVEIVMDPEFQISPHDQMVQSENREIVREIISGLPESFRDIIQMREIEGCSYREIASITGANINSLRVSVSRARQIIKEKYLNYSYERGTTKRATGKVL